MRPLTYLASKLQPANFSFLTSIYAAKGGITISKFMGLSIVVMLGLAGCGSVPNATVTPTHATLRMPKMTDIKSLNIESDYASRATLLPSDPTTTIKQVLTMLQTAQPVSVQFPQSKNKITGESSGYSGPATLHLNLSTNEDVMITPAYFIWSASQGGFDYHYLDGIVEYREGDSTTYLKDPSLYNWLKQDQWKSEFHLQTGY